MTQAAFKLESERKANAYLKAHTFLQVLKKYNGLITGHEFKTLRGQALAGDVEGATKGLERILGRKG